MQAEINFGEGGRSAKECPSFARMHKAEPYASLRPVKP